MTEPNPYASPLAPPEPAERPTALSAGSVGKLGGVFALLALAAGMASRTVRPLITGSFHYEALAGLVLLILLSVILTVFSLRSRQVRAERQLQVAHAAVWLAHFIGWAAVDAVLGFQLASLLNDLLGILLVWWLGLAIGILVVWRIRGWLRPARAAESRQPSV